MAYVQDLPIGSDERWSLLPFEKPWPGEGRQRHEAPRSRDRFQPTRHGGVFSCHAARSGRCHQGCQRQGFDERSVRAAKGARASMPLMQQHAHHRDLLARAAAETQAHGNSTKDQHRHLVTELMLDRYKYAQCLCWHPADNAVAFVMTATLPFG